MGFAYAQWLRGATSYAINTTTNKLIRLLIIILLIILQQTLQTESEITCILTQKVFNLT